MSPKCQARMWILNLAESILRMGVAWYMPQARPNSHAMTKKTAALLDPPVGPEAGAGPGVPDDREEVPDGGADFRDRQVVGEGVARAGASRHRMPHNQPETSISTCSTQWK